jgi:hypothetical protein
MPTPSTVNSPFNVSRLISANTTNATVVKSSPGVVGGWALYNINAAVRYLKVYNKATAPTVGTDTPALTILIPSNSGNNFQLPKEIEFDAGISFALTTGITDADSTAVAASEIIVNLFYK